MVRGEFTQQLALQGFAGFVAERLVFLQVTVTDEVGKTDSQTIDVTVTDVNEAPGLALASYGIAENTTHVARIAASDPEADELIFSIAGGADGVVHLVDMDRRTVLSRIDLGEPIGVLVYARDGSRLAVGAGSQLVFLDPERGTVLARSEQHRDAITSITHDRQRLDRSNCGSVGASSKRQERFRLFGSSSGDLSGVCHDDGLRFSEICANPDLMGLAC